MLKKIIKLALPSVNGSTWWWLDIIALSHIFSSGSVLGNVSKWITRLNWKGVTQISVQQERPQSPLWLVRVEGMNIALGLKLYLVAFSLSSWPTRPLCKEKAIFKFIHSSLTFSKCFILVTIMVDPEPARATLGTRQEYTLDGTPTH